MGQSLRAKFRRGLLFKSIIWSITSTTSLQWEDEVREREAPIVALHKLLSMIL